MASLVWNTSKQQASPYERSPPHHASYQQRQQQQCERREREGKKYSRGSIYTLVEPERVEKLSGTRQKGAEPRQRRPSSPTFLINASTLAMQLSPSSLSLSLCPPTFSTFPLPEEWNHPERTIDSLSSSSSSKTCTREY